VPADLVFKFKALPDSRACDVPGSSVLRRLTKRMPMSGSYVLAD
jgi:hypothetical protein